MEAPNGPAGFLWPCSLRPSRLFVPAEPQTEGFAFDLDSTPYQPLLRATSLSAGPAVYTSRFILYHFHVLCPIQSSEGLNPAFARTEARFSDSPSSDRSSCNITITITISPSILHLQASLFNTTISTLSPRASSCLPPSAQLRTSTTAETCHWLSNSDLIDGLAAPASRDAFPALAFRITKTQAP